MKKILVGLLFFITILDSTAQTSNALSIVQTDAGFISGTVNKDGSVHIFKGIPFAAPPVGDLRWKAPQPVQAWTGTKKCETFGASPVQGKPVPFMMYTSEFLIPAEPISEDCLYLNVWTKSSEEKKPVIVWICGGGFISGSGACPIYDGENMAKKGVVFVTINYRLGVFGFLALPELTSESPDHASGNYALLDQIAALRWVQKNIAAFGGDPERVTIAGQSAGAYSVNALVASPLTKGLFQRAIAQSGGMFNSDGRVLNLQTAEQNGLKIMEAVKAGSLEEMRNKPTDELLKATSMNAIGPVVDGFVLPTSVYNIFEQAKQNDVPVLTGWNGDEGFVMGNVRSVEAYKADAAKQYKELADEFLKAFPGNSPDEIKKSDFAWSRDNFFAWHAYAWAKLENAKGKNKVFLYQFNRVPPGDEKYGAFHSAEICYALNTLHTWDRKWTDADRKLEDIMSSYWVNFAATGDPNGKNLPEWKPFDPKLNMLMAFDEKKVSMKPIAAKNEFDFIDQYQEQLRKQ